MPSAADIPGLLKTWATVLAGAGHPDGAAALLIVRDDGVDSLPAAMGAPWGWRATAQHQARDDAIRQLHAQHFPELVGRAAARAVGGALRRYQSTSWPRDRRSHRRPDGVDGACYDLLTLADRVPSEETLRRMFAAERERLAG